MDHARGHRDGIPRREDVVVKQGGDGDPGIARERLGHSRQCADVRVRPLLLVRRCDDPPGDLGRAIPAQESRGGTDDIPFADTLDDVRIGTGLVQHRRGGGEVPPTHVDLKRLERDEHLGLLRAIGVERGSLGPPALGRAGIGVDLHGERCSRGKQLDQGHSAVGIDVGEQAPSIGSVDDRRRTRGMGAEPQLGLRPARAAVPRRKTVDHAPVVLLERAGDDVRHQPAGGTASSSSITGIPSRTGKPRPHAVHTRSRLVASTSSGA